MKQTKKTRILSIAVLLVILMSSLTMAFGIAIPYWDSPEWYPLKLAPGESKIVELTLQNTGEEDMTIQASIESDIATLDEEIKYSVPSGEINEIVSIEVKIPEDAEIGTRYKVYSSFHQVSTGEGGMVAMTGAFTINFPVEVVGEQESELFDPLSKQKPILPWIILGTLLIGMIVIAIVKNKKKEKKK